MSFPSPNTLIIRLREKAADWQNDYRLMRLAIAVSQATRASSSRPVIFFKASSGILRMSLNSAFNLLAAWGLEMQGVPVIHFICQAGMSRCVLGTDRDNPYKKPPCAACTRHARVRAYRQHVHAFYYLEDMQLAAALEGLNLQDLSKFEYHFKTSHGEQSQAVGDSQKISENSRRLVDSIPLGEIVLPSLRWILRRHNLPDDEPTCFLMRQYILSAYRVAQEFTVLLDQSNPQAVVVYNGMFFPEAIARRLAKARGIRVITHEVALRPFTAFFTPGEATAYPIHIPPDFELSPSQEQRLDAYLEERFKGRFTMAGIRFWPEMRGLDETFLQRAAQFKQIVPVFTNVIFDTSQVHANTIFPDMFAWLDAVLDIARLHPETLFVIRAHPDEMRPSKASRDSVRSWVERSQATSLPNIVFVDSLEFISSYDLIQRSKFVMVYNSSIGLEASLMGAPVLCAGKARYTQYPTVFLPTSQQDFRNQAENFLQTASIEVPPDFRLNARRFLYYQLFLTSLPFDEYLEEHGKPGFVKLRNFNLKQLSPDHSPTMRIILDGILGETHDFTLDPKIS
jgi:hypothetical protein